MQLGAFWCFFAYYIRAPQTSSFACYMRPHSGPFLSFLAYYMGAPSEQFLRIDYGGPLRSVYSLIMEASILMYFFHTIWGPLGSFLCIVYWGPQITFFAYYMGPLRSVSSHTIWGPLSDHFHCLLYGAPLRSVSLHAIGGPPQILVFSQNIWGPPQISFSAYYMGPLRLVSLLTIWAPLRLVSVHTFWVPLSDKFFFLLYGAPSDHFFAYYMGGPSDQFHRLLYEGPLRSVSSLTI